MAEYTVGVVGKKFERFGGTWRVAERNEQGFLLWESEKHGNRALKLLTDKEGNILLNGVRSFSDFGARVQITKYENMKEHIAGKMILEELKKQEKSPENAANSNQGNIIPGSKTSIDGNATTGSEPQQISMKRPERKRPATKNPHGRESVLSKLHEYQRYVDQKKPKAQ